jgi:hypothetical protein
MRLAKKLDWKGFMRRTEHEVPYYPITSRLLLLYFLLILTKLGSYDAFGKLQHDSPRIEAKICPNLHVGNFREILHLATAMTI